jgi:hypothetical protein
MLVLVSLTKKMPGQHGAAAAAEHQPQRAEHFGDRFALQVHAGVLRLIGDQCHSCAGARGRIPRPCGLTKDER